MKSKMIFFGILLTSLFVLGGMLNKSQTLEQEENLENTELAIYVEDEKVDTIPSKGNQDGYVFDKASCYVDGNEDGSVTVSWDNDSWAPIVKGLSTYKTRCDLHLEWIFLVKFELSLIIQDLVQKWVGMEPYL